MSVDYAAGLSHYDDLGVCGLDEVFDKVEVVKEKVRVLAEWLRQYRGSCLVHVGAGLSTSAGIPDFRGKTGVWTKLLQSKHEIPTICNDNVKSIEMKVEAEASSSDLKPFDETVPTIGHLVLKELCDNNYVRHIISQNVDGLFLKSNLSRNFISELHGNFYLDECTRCHSRFIRENASETMRLQRSSRHCPRSETTNCKGYLRDTILDWESPIPYNELRIATRESKRNKLHICIGTSMQLKPSKDLVCNPTRNKSTKLVIINLQPTQNDKIANLVINYYSDEVMKMLANELKLSVPDYNSNSDPTKQNDRVGSMWKR